MDWKRVHFLSLYINTYVCMDSWMHIFKLYFLFFCSLSPVFTVSLDSRFC